jgi:hypothetical protein
MGFLGILQILTAQFKFAAVRNDHVFKDRLLASLETLYSDSFGCYEFYLTTFNRLVDISCQFVNFESGHFTLLIKAWNKV